MKQIENQSKYYYEIDILRGIACLLVFFSHLPIYRVFGLPKSNDFISGAAGVYIFFVISGFIITKTLNHQLIKLDTFNLNFWYDSFIKNRDKIFLFWYRRYLRLFPALCLLFCCAFIFIIRAGIRNHDFVVYIVAFFRSISALVLLTNPFEHTDGTKFLIAKTLGVTWSLTYEVLFYLIFPFIVIFKDFSKILIATLIIGFIVGNQNLLPYNAFIIGVLVGVYHDKVNLNNRLIKIFTIVTLYLLIISDINPNIGNKYYNTYILSSAFLVYVATIQQNILNFPILGPILNFIGKRSYFIYLMHNIVDLLITNRSIKFLEYYSDYIPHLKILFLKNSLTIYHIVDIVILILVIILADLFYRFVERPFIEKNKHKIFVSN